MFDRQCDLEKARGQQKLAEIGAQRDAAIDVGVMDAFNAAINQQADMAKAAGGWAATLSASVRPVVTYWMLAIWSIAHFVFMWNAWSSGFPAIEIFRQILSPDFCALPISPAVAVCVKRSVAAMSNALRPPESRRLRGERGDMLDHFSADAAD